MGFLVYIIVGITSLGLLAQCISNFKQRRAEFLSFPIALLIFFPYFFWAALALFKQDMQLLVISVVMGGPSIWLSVQYFEYETRSRLEAIEDRVTLALMFIAALLFMMVWWSSSIVEAVAIVAAYLTCCIAVFSYLVKVFRVSRKHENLDGLKWSTLIVLLIYYASMMYVGKSNNIPMLYLSYIFSMLACLLAVIYKAIELAKKKASLQRP